MTIDSSWLRRGVVIGAALVYWGGVWVQARRVRHQIHRSPNVAPRGLKEKLLWVGWMLVTAVWLGQPFWIRPDHSSQLLIPWLLNPVGLGLGILLVIAGYAGTLACYRAMGGAWRMGVNPAETTTLVTRGPYRVVRHPIYLFQGVMLTGSMLLLPTGLSCGVLLLHLVCVLVKVVDEEAYLLGAHGDVYRDYARHTGALFPHPFRTRSERRQ